MVDIEKSKKKLQYLNYIYNFLLWGINIIPYIIHFIHNSYEFVFDQIFIYIGIINIFSLYPFFYIFTKRKFLKYQINYYSKNN